MWKPEDSDPDFPDVSPFGDDPTAFEHFPELESLLQEAPVPLLSDQLRARVLSEARRVVPLRRRMLLVMGADFAVHWLPAQRVWLKSWSQISFGTARLAVRQREAATVALLIGLLLCVSWVATGWGASYLTQVVQNNLVPSTGVRLTAFPSNQSLSAVEHAAVADGNRVETNRLARLQGASPHWPHRGGQHTTLRSFSEPGMAGLVDYESSLIATEMAFRQRAFRWFSRTPDAG